MDQAQEPIGPVNRAWSDNLPAASRISRRELIKLGLGGLACASLAGCSGKWTPAIAQFKAGAEVFKNGAPDETVWKQWEAHGWVREAAHYRQLGKTVHCVLCPNGCLLEPGDRSHCRNRVNRDGKLYTLAYANACALSIDPIEKKPLFHYLPGAAAFSFATSGCGFRCLNCQNWDISQSRPEDVKDATGEPLRLTPEELRGPRADRRRLTMTPDDIALAAEYYKSATIAYTYSEPTVWYEYMLDTAKLARARKIKNVWVTCGFIESEPLADFCKYLDAASVNLKSFSDDVYRDLNSGRMQPVLDTLKTLKREGVWVEVINLVVPTYTDKPEMIRPLCAWVVENMGPDCPLHFSRFHPAHKLDKLPPTPTEILIQAREIAHQAGLRYVYIGNSPEPYDAETTFCPKCTSMVIDRCRFRSHLVGMTDGACLKCGTKIAGVWA